MDVDWSPAQYQRFAAQRALPFHDLLALVQPADFHRGIDLGCGPGELTALATQRLDVAEMLGIDNSLAMLESAARWATPHLRFAAGDIDTWTADHDHDLVLASASLQWVPDHPALLARLTEALGAGGQLLVQVPANSNMPSHRVATDLANSATYSDAFGPQGPPPDPVAENVLQPEQYSQLLFDLGFEQQHVRLQVYPHVLPTTAAIVEWTRGTTLTRFQKLCPPDVFAQFVTDYEQQLVDLLGDARPQFFPFRRILMWGRMP
ncbi:MAG: methyltransferase domain-containing protein [Ilumatobacteraceae bacterium]